MAKTLIFRNATTSGLASVVGTLAELFVDTTLKTVVVMDGVTSGGTTLARNADVQTLSSTTATNLATVSSTSFTNFTTLSSSTTSSIAYLSSVAATRATTSTFGVVQANGSSITVSAGTLSLGSSITAAWTIQQSSNGSLYFYHSGVAKFRLGTDGVFSATSNVGAFVTI
jgi:hypothetical protein